MSNAPAPSPAEQAVIERFDAAPVPPEVVVETVALLADEARETVGLGALVRYAQQQGLYCCSVGCGSGGCETCPCCCAGWCVSGLDGLPEDPEDRASWLDIAAEHNPLAAAIAALPPSPADGHDIVVEIYDGLDISMRCITCRERIAVRPESAAASLHELYRLAEDHSRAALASPAPAPQGEEGRR